MFENKTIVITGGTGSFGHQFLKSILSTNYKEVRIFSRDEKKQDDMRLELDNPKVKFCIGDIRDYSSINYAIEGADYCFHAAALKQVPSCEFYPMEAFKTNVVGTYNIIKASFQNKLKKIVCLSTDKAVYPINAMGISKAMMEKILIAESRQINSKLLTVSGTRYGNVMASRGSVIPLFFNQILSGEPITLTDPNMTRFMMSLEDAVNLVKYSFENAANGDIFVRKSPAVTIKTLVESILQILSKPSHKINIIGTRHGEKLYESLLSREEMAIARDEGDFFRIPLDSRDLNYNKYYVDGKKEVSDASEYSSHNAYILNKNEMIEMLLSLPYVKSILKNNSSMV